MKNCISGGKPMTSMQGVHIKQPSQKRIAKLLKKKRDKKLGINNGK